MDLINYFVEHFDISNYEVEASIYAESMNCNSLSFVVRPHDWYITFRIACGYGEHGQLITRKVIINNADFLGKYKYELEQKLTKKLEEKEFINQLNSAIQKEKDRVKRIYENTMRQSEVDFIDKTKD